MKLMRYGAMGQERPALLDKDGRVRDLSGVLPDITAQTLMPEQLRRLAAIDAGSLPVVDNPGRIAPPWKGVGKFVAVGLNYTDHAEEAGMPIPKEPVIFMKAPSCIVGPNDPVVMPRGSTKTDYEVELGIVIGSMAREVSEAEAIRHVAGYCVVNDVSERLFQLEQNGTQWDKGKCCDTYGPVGPWLVTTDEITDPQSLDMWLDVNGQRRQTGNTRTMIFGVAYLVSYLSRYMTLYPGDLITTGTPPGVGLGFKPPRYLKAGERVRLGISGLGEQDQTMHDWDPALIMHNL